MRRLSSLLVRDPGQQINLTVSDVPDGRKREQIMDGAEGPRAVLATRGDVEDHDLGLDGVDESKAYRVTTDRGEMIAAWALLDDGKSVVRLVVEGTEDTLDVEGVAQSLEVTPG